MRYQIRNIHPCCRTESGIFLSTTTHQGQSFAESSSIAECTCRWILWAFPNNINYLRCQVPVFFSLTAKLLKPILCQAVAPRTKMLHQQSIQQSCRMVRTKNQAPSQMSLKDLARIHDVDTEVEPKEQETHLVVYAGPNFLAERS